MAAPSRGRAAASAGDGRVGAACAGPAGQVWPSIDPIRLNGSWLEAVAQPRALARETGRLMVEQLRIALGLSDVAPNGDARFADPAWAENPFYRRLGQLYLAWEASMTRLVDGASTDWRTRERARFANVILTSAASPTNFLLGNPAALKRAFETGGMSLARGTRNWLRDVRENGGMPAQADLRPFKVGDNMAVTPGAVVFRNEVCEVIQYSPSTREVYTRPVLMVPPQINKYYFMDLAPGRSFVEHAVSRGLQFFTISWRNPRPEHRDWSLDTYLEATSDAVDAVREIARSDDVNLLGLCAGGITMAALLGSMAATRDARVQSASFAVTILDFETPSLLGMFATDDVIAQAKRKSQRRGVFPGDELGRVFAWLRPNDLVWNYWVNNYLLGKDPPAFDILAWNADATNLTAGLHTDFLDIFLDNTFGTPGGVVALGQPVNLAKVRLDSYVVGGITDHLTPWQACYRTTQLLGGESRFVLTGSGHIQSLVNPPGNPKARLWTNGSLPPDPEQWLQGSELRQGATWWDDWVEWVTARSGDRRRARTGLGSRRNPAAEPAPGTYVYDGI